MLAQRNMRPRSSTWIATLVCASIASGLAIAASETAARAASAAAAEGSSGGAAGGGGAGAAGSAGAASAGAGGKLLPAPPGRVAFRSYAAADGLTNLVVTGMAEDATGARWVTTDEGLFRLDGERFARMGPAEGITSSHFHGVEVGPSGEICVGTPVELVCQRHGRFERLLPLDVSQLARSPGALWIMTSRGLFVWRGTGAPQQVPELPARAMQLLWADERGVIAGDGAALWRWNAPAAAPAAASAAGGAAVSRRGGEPSWQPLLLELSAAAKDELRELLRDEGGALWLRSSRQVWRVLPGETLAREVTHGLPSAMDLRFGQSMAQGGGGEITVATSAGLGLFRGDRWQMLDGERGLPTRSAHVVFYDRAGELWFGSVGVHRRLGRGLIEQHTAATGLPGEAVWAIARGAEGELLVGTSQCLAQVVSGRWACATGTVGQVVRSIAALPDGGALFGGVPAELYQRNAAGEVALLADLEAEAGARQLLAVAVGDDGAVWIGADNGLYWRPPDAAVVRLVEASGGRTKRFVSAIVKDGPRLWVAGFEGVRVLEDGVWTHLGERSGLRATATRYLVRRHDGRLCVLYDEGLGVTCFRYGGGELSEVQHFDAEDGLDPLTAYSMGEDASGRLWLGTGMGLRVLAHEPGGGIDRFTVRDGLAGDDASAMAFHLDGDGGLWFGSSSGLTHVAGSSYRGPAPPPAVRILALRIGARALVGKAAGGGDDDDEADDEGALLGGFVASSADVTDVEYQARLAPSQDGWMPAPTRRVRFSGLAAGSYQLEVQARRRGGAWGPITRVPFEIPPAWWQSGWLWALGGLAGAAATALLVLGWQRAAMRRRTRALLAQTEASFRAFLASMPELVIVRRADGGVLLNDSARNLFGHAAERDRMWILRSVHPADRRRAAALLRGAPISKGSAGSASERLVEVRVRAGEQWRDLEVSHQVVALGGAPARILVGRDVTERRRLQAQMLMADRMVSLGTLVAGIGHEINNPLSYVLGNLEVIGEVAERADFASGKREIKAAVRDALDGATRVRTIVQRLGSFSRSSEEVRLPVMLDEVIAQAVRLTHNELRHRAKVVLATEPVPPVLADPGQLTQVIINLLINAAHAIAPGAADRHRITLRTRTSGEDQVLLEVSDTGTGMDSQVVTRAFDPFFTTKRVGEGTGLGLSICHGIITSHGGQITVESQRGRGTTMRVTLPAHREARAQLTASSGELGASGASGGGAVSAGTVEAAPLAVAEESSGVSRSKSGSKSGKDEAAGAAKHDAVIARAMAVGSQAVITGKSNMLTADGLEIGAVPTYIEPVDPSLVLPAADPAAPPRPRVLVIDDEPAVGKVLARMLRSVCDVEVLTDGEDALRRISAGERFSAIITDVMMPVLTGFELREQLLIIDPEQARRVVFITGGVFNSETAELLEQPNIRCMTKPVDAEALRRTVSEVAAEAWSERSAALSSIA